MREVLVNLSKSTIKRFELGHYYKYYDTIYLCCGSGKGSLLLVNLKTGIFWDCTIDCNDELKTEKKCSKILRINSRWFRIKNYCLKRESMRKITIKEKTEIKNKKFEKGKYYRLGTDVYLCFKHWENNSYKLLLLSLNSGLKWSPQDCNDELNTDNSCAKIHEFKLIPEGSELNIIV